MEIYLSRQEIRRQMRAHLGQVDSEAQAIQTGDQYNVFINLAARKVAMDRHWQASETRTTLIIGAAQNNLSYPPGVSCGGISDVSVWDPIGNEYCKVHARRIPNRMDQDQEQIIGGETFTAVQGRPRLYDQRSPNWFVWPFTDQSYKLRVTGTLSPLLNDDADLSVVDGGLIVLYGTFLAFCAQNEVIQQQVYKGLYDEALIDLTARESSGEDVITDRSCDMSDDLCLRFPNWDTSPTIIPGALPPDTG